MGLVLEGRVRNGHVSTQTKQTQRKLFWGFEGKKLPHFYESRPRMKASFSPLLDIVERGPKVWNCQSCLTTNEETKLACGVGRGESRKVQTNGARASGLSLS